jgi:aspartate/methionine/tyrosine aminotransferase
MTTALPTQTELRLAKRMSRLGSETAFEVLAKARALEAQGKDIVHLEIGEPDFDTPQNVIDAGIKAIHDGYTHYSPSAGMPELRQTVADDVTRTHGVKVNADEVVIVPGGKPTIYFTFTALVEEGDEVIYPNPGFPIYESLINFTGAKAVPLQMREEKNFRLDPNELADLITDRTKLIVLNSPHNPTGSVLTQQDVKDIATAIGDRDIMVLSDEIYSRLIFEGQHHSLMSLPGWRDRVIMLDGWSKTYAMTGWRLGYGVMRKDLAAHFGRLMTNVNSCSAGFTQVAGMEALKGDQTSVVHMCSQFKARRDKFIAGLNNIKGFSCTLPHGAFYAFPNIKKTGWESRKLAEAMLNDAGVACLSGTAFGAFGEGYLRFSIANSMENLDKALDRINTWAKKNL